MITKTFYRIEYNDNGFYESGVVDEIPELEKMKNRHLDKTILPNKNFDDIIYREMKLHPRIHYRFCFNNYLDLCRLIKVKELKLLFNYGCRLYEIKSRNYCSSQYQTIVNGRTIISKEDITRFV